MAASKGSTGSSLLATRVFLLLVIGAATIFLLRLTVGDVDLSDLGHRVEYEYEQDVAIHAAPGEYTVTMFYPRAEDRVQILEESFEYQDLDLQMSNDVQGRRFVVAGSQQVTSKSVMYRARLVLEPVEYHMNEELEWSDLKDATPRSFAATELIQTGHSEINQQLSTVLGIAASDARDLETPDAWQRVLADSGLGPVETLTLLYNYCHDGISSASFSGTTDALTTLRLKEASCGGKSRLMAALCRTLGIECRIVGGVLLGDSRRKRTSHVWLECHVAQDWVPFDPLNGHFASTPGHVLPLYRGDVALLRHTRGLAFDYGFVSRFESVPATWQRESDTDIPAASLLSEIPLLRRNEFSILLLAPFALLLAVFMRQVVGLECIGTFLPVLLGYSLLQSGLFLGGIQMLAAILLGVIMRLLMVRLNLLQVSRASVLITGVLLLFLMFSFVFEAMGIESQRGSLILPMAALAMTIERFSLAALDRGFRGASILLAQTIVLSFACAGVLSLQILRSVTVTFPEVLLVVIAEIVIIGNYRGLRLRELWRFRQVQPQSAAASGVAR